MARVIAFVLFALVTSTVAAQPRRSIPERACHRVSLELQPLTGARGMGLRITNVTPGDFAAPLRAEVAVERETSGTWQPVGVVGLLLREGCDEAPSGCVTLPAHASMTIVPWTGRLGDAQCECTGCTPAPAGRYRFVVTGCIDCLGGGRSESAPFDLPPP